ncbi:MAG TPA: cell division protein ZapA [Xanthobacteraceae bacterium]|jgi:cell division protein ZapA|nr:cell division protein ZapA [Xanthobacteraceae bacterium]
MAHVSVTISGRQYRMACDDGQEHHLARLSHELDQRIAHLRTTFGEIGDMRLTVMAALILADELSEARQRMKRVEEELAAMQEARIAAAGQADAVQADVAAVFNAAAERIEKAARLLGDAGDGRHIVLG